MNHGSPILYMVKSRGLRKLFHRNNMTCNGAKSNNDKRFH
jgi:hypothetical protein